MPAAATCAATTAARARRRPVADWRHDKSKRSCDHAWRLSHIPCSRRTAGLENFPPGPRSQRRSCSGLGRSGGRRMEEYRDVAGGGPPRSCPPKSTLLRAVIRIVSMQFTALAAPATCLAKQSGENGRTTPFQSCAHRSHRHDARQDEVADFALVRAIAGRARLG